MRLDRAIQAARDAVNSRCLEIVQEIVSNGRLATVDFVTQVLLNRYGVPDFISLNVGNMREIPVLLLLIEIYQKCNSFLSCYFGCRSIISYLDLECELVQVLQSFSIPSVNSLYCKKICNQPLSQQNHDPLEIDIDDGDHIDTASAALAEKVSGNAPALTCFLDYGVGPLHLHNSVSLYFPQLAFVDTSKCFATSTDILGCLSSSEIDFSRASIDSLESHLCSEFNVNCLQEVGIIIVGNLKLELTMIRHVYAARMRLLTEIQKKQLEEFANQDRRMRESSSYNVNQVTSNRRDRNKGTPAPSASDTKGLVGPEQTLESTNSSNCNVPCITTSRPTVSSFISRCSALLADSPYSPSFSKVLNAVEKICRESSKSGKCVPMESKKRSRGRKAIDSKDLDSLALQEHEGIMHLHHNDDHANISANTASVICEVAAEYLMLHLGGGKYCAKRLVGADSVSYNDSTIKNSVSKECGHVTINSCLESAEDNLDILQNVPTDLSTDVLDATVQISLTSEPVQSPSPSPLVAAAGRLNSDASGGSNVHAVFVTEAVTMADTSIRIAAESLSFDQGFKSQSSLEKHATVFECRLFGHSNVSVESGGQPSRSLQVISNECLKDITPWCVGIPLGSDVKGPVLDAGDLRAVGRWGEALVYQYLLNQSSSASVDRTTLSSPAVEWLNRDEESRAGYDLVTRETRRLVNKGLGSAGRPTSITETTYIEVKTTRFDDLNTFEISLWEWQFATANPRVRYHIYRVFNAGDPKKVRIVVVDDILEMITSRKVRLCLNI